MGLYFRPWPSHLPPPPTAFSDCSFPSFFPWRHNRYSLLFFHLGWDSNARSGGVREKSPSQSWDKKALEKCILLESRCLQWRRLCIFHNHDAASPSARPTGETLKSSQREPGDLPGGIAYKSVRTTLRLLYPEVSHFQGSLHIVSINSSKFKNNKHNSHLELNIVVHYCLCMYYLKNTCHCSYHWKFGK